jgi:hypothetical protein
MAVLIHLKAGHARFVSGVVIDWDRTTDLKVVDPGCQAGYWKGFDAAACTTSKAVEHGKELVLQLRLQDPVHLSRKRFIEVLAAELVIHNLNQLQAEINDNSTPEIQGSLHIRLKVTEWNFWVAEKPTKILTDTPMQFWFAVRGALTRKQGDDTLWTDICFYRSNEQGQGPYKFGDLHRKDGAMMKEIIERAAHICGEDLAKKLLAAHPRT